MSDVPLQVPPSNVTIAPARERPRRKRGWIIALAIVVVLAIAAWFGGDALARNLITGAVKSKLTSALGMDADHPIDIEISGAVLPQLISGSFAEVHVASDDVPLGALVGDVTATARGAHLDATADEITATALLDPAQFISFIEPQELRDAVTSLEADGQELAVTAVFKAFGADIDVRLNATVSLGTNNTIVLTPTTATVAGMELDLTNLSGAAAMFLPERVTDVLTGGIAICLADKIPSGVTLTDITLSAGQLRVDADIDAARVAADGTMPSGTCS